jgi:hypothetical protein
LLRERHRTALIDQAQPSACIIRPDDREASRIDVAQGLWIFRIASAPHSAVAVSVSEPVASKISGRAGGLQDLADDEVGRRDHAVASGGRARRRIIGVDRRRRGRRAARQTCTLPVPKHRSASAGGPSPLAAASALGRSGDCETLPQAAIPSAATNLASCVVGVPRLPR